MRLAGLPPLPRKQQESNPDSKFWKKQKKRKPNPMKGPPVSSPRPFYRHYVHASRKLVAAGREPTELRRKARWQAERDEDWVMWVRPGIRDQLSQPCEKCGAPINWPCTITGLSYPDNRMPPPGWFNPNRVHRPRLRAVEAAAAPKKRQKSPRRRTTQK